MDFGIPIKSAANAASPGLCASTQFDIDLENQLFNPHQRCGYNDSPFARIYFFYTAGSRNRFEGMESVCRHTKKQKNTAKRHFFLMEKYNEDVRQDLLEAIMRPPDPVKGELRQKLSKIDQFEPKIEKIRVCTFQMSGKIRDSTNVAFEAPCSPLLAIFGPAGGQIYGKSADKKFKIRF